MRKIGLTLFFLIYGCIPHSYAGENEEIGSSVMSPVVTMDFNIRTQSRSAIPVTINKAINGQTVLDSHDKLYSLTGIDIPDEIAPETSKRLSALVEGQKCTVYQTRRDDAGRTNRMGQILAHMTCGKDDDWIQGHLIAEGLAQVRTTPENNQQATAMLLVEMQARQNKRGLWGETSSSLLDAKTVSGHMNSFVVVQGDVFTVSQNRNSVFLNFSADWKTDFTIGIPAKLRKDFSKLHINLLDLKNSTVRVRGWVRSYNGAYIELDHVEQLEIVRASPLHQ